MNQECIKQASQSEREKHGIEKDESDESVHIAAPEMQTWRTDLGTRVVKKRERVT